MLYCEDRNCGPAHARPGEHWSQAPRKDVPDKVHAAYCGLRCCGARHHDSRIADRVPGSNPETFFQHWESGARGDIRNGAFGPQIFKKDNNTTSLTGALCWMWLTVSPCHVNSGQRVPKDFEKPQPGVRSIDSNRGLPFRCGIHSEIGVSPAAWRIVYSTAEGPPDRRK